MPSFLDFDKPGLNKFPEHEPARRANQRPIARVGSRRLATRQLATGPWRLATGHRLPATPRNTSYSCYSPPVALDCYRGRP